MTRARFQSLVGPSLLAVLAAAAPAAAQVSYIAAGYGPWYLDAGTFSSSPTVLRSISGVVRFDVRAAPALELTWAAENDENPGAMSLTLGVRRALFGDDDEVLFLDLDAGVVRIAADNQPECFEPACTHEGISYETGWGPAAALDFGLGIGLPKPLYLELSAGVLLTHVQRTRGFRRVAIGLGWIP